MADDLGTLADDLYALPAEDFVAERDARVKRIRADGNRDLARQVAALPRPTVAAWLLNQLARRRTAAVEELVGLGAEMRAAQESLDGDQMRALNRQRHQVVRAFSRQVAELGDELGRPVSDAVAQQVEETLRAAVADEEAGHALLSGRLTAALSYVGMGEVSVSAAVAVPRAGRARPVAPASDKAARADEDQPPDELAAARERHRKAAREAVGEAKSAAEEADEALAHHDRQVSELAEHWTRLQDRLESLRAELTQAEADADAVRTEQRDAQRRRDDADQAAREARDALERARRDLDDNTDAEGT